MTDIPIQRQLIVSLSDRLSRHLNRLKGSDKPYDESTLRSAYGLLQMHIQDALGIPKNDVLPVKTENRFTFLGSGELITSINVAFRDNALPPAGSNYRYQPSSYEEKEFLVKGEEGMGFSTKAIALIDRKLRDRFKLPKKDPSEEPLVTAVKMVDVPLNM